MSADINPSADGRALAATASPALFVPLRGEYFDAFAEGRKWWEYRLLGPRWNATTCAVGRRVVLSRGYGKSRRMTGTITEFMEVQHPEALPGWVACYGYHAGRAACFRIKVDLPPNAQREPRRKEDGQ